MRAQQSQRIQMFQVFLAASLEPPWLLEHSFQPSFLHPDSCWFCCPYKFCVKLSRLDSRRQPSACTDEQGDIKTESLQPWFHTAATVEDTSAAAPPSAARVVLSSIFKCSCDLVQPHTCRPSVPARSRWNSHVHSSWVERYFSGLCFVCVSVKWGEQELVFTGICRQTDGAVKLSEINISETLNSDAEQNIGCLVFRSRSHKYWICQDCINVCKLGVLSVVRSAAVGASWQNSPLTFTFRLETKHSDSHSSGAFVIHLI